MPLELKQHENGFWYVHGTVTVWRNGKPNSIEVRKSTRKRNYHEADAIRRQIESSEAEQNITGRKPAISFREAAKRYVTNGGERRFLASSPQGPFLLHHRFDRLANMAIDEITQQILDDEGVKAYANSATRRRQWHAPVLAALRSAGVKEQFDRPADGEKRTYFLTPMQAVKHLKMINATRYPNPWTPALATFLYGQGSRVSETLGIDGKDDISLEGRYAILRDTKNGLERMVNLCPLVIAAVSTLPNLGKKGPLFLRYDGRPYVDREDRGYKLVWWKRGIEGIGLDAGKYTPHIARHSWATWFYAQTKDVVRLTAEGGWESDEWKRYVKLAAPILGKQAIDLGFDFRGDDQNGQRTNFAEFLRA